MAITRDFMKRYQFFRDHAGFIVGQRALCAFKLAKAEQWLRAQDNIEMVRKPEPDPDLSWLSGEERQQDHECEVFILVEPCPHHGLNCQHALNLASVGNVVDADANYARVLFAELASEIMP
jgi:pyrimidine deaminase RibD-like protein